MLLRSLTQAQRSMSALELTHYWQPTWTQNQVELMLADLLSSKQVCAEGVHVVRYRSAVLSPIETTGTDASGQRSLRQGGFHHGIS